MSEVLLYNLNPAPWTGGRVAIPGACWVDRRPCASFIITNIQNKLTDLYGN